MVKADRGRGMRVFLDLKFLDIENGSSCDEVGLLRWGSSS